MSTEDYRQPDHRDHPETQTGVTNPAPTPRTDGDLNVLWDKPGITLCSAETSTDVPEPETPLTDAEASDGWSGDAVCVSVEFAKRLEKALAAKDAEIARRKAQLDMWTSAAMDGNAAIAQLTARAEKAETELADERRYVQIEHVDSWAKIQDALPPHKEGDDRPLVQVVLDALAELAETKKRNAELQMAVDLAVDHTAERDQLRAEVDRLKAEVLAASDDASAQAKQKNELRAELAAAMQDKERLDWVQSNHADIDFEGGTFVIYTPRNQLGCGASGRAFRDIRAAIDAARSKELDTAG